MKAQSAASRNASVTKAASLRTGNVPYEAHSQPVVDPNYVQANIHDARDHLGRVLHPEPQSRAPMPGERREVSRFQPQRKAPPVVTYCALGPNCWGTGSTREQAVRNAKEYFPRNYKGIKRPQDKHFSIFSSEGEFEVDCVSGVVRSTKSITRLQKSILAD